jgi:hypothetical protein
MGTLLMAHQGIPHPFLVDVLEMIFFEYSVRCSRGGIVPQQLHSEGGLYEWNMRLRPGVFWTCV